MPVILLDLIRDFHDEEGRWLVRRMNNETLPGSMGDNEWPLAADVIQGFERRGWEVHADRRDDADFHAGGRLPSA